MDFRIDGLHPTLVAKIVPCVRDHETLVWRADPNEQAVRAPLAGEASIEGNLTWQSPFEGAGVESRFPALAQMAQSGMFQGVLSAIGEKFSDTGAKSYIDELRAQAAKMEGRTGITKLNSTQVFSGMPPLKIAVTMVFQAFSDPLTEVEEPISRLWDWALPQELAPDGTIAELIRTEQISALMPSKVPRMISVEYKGRQFMPMVIESISDPIGAPSDRHGDRVSAQLQVTFCTLTALDRKDWAKTYINRASS